MLRKQLQGLTVALLVLLASAAWGQQAATVADLEGSGESGKRGAYTPVKIGTAVNVGDEVRTGRPGRLRLVFQDESVLTIGDDTKIIIDEQTFDPAQGLYSTVIRVLQGKVRSLVSPYYTQAGATYEIETVTAVASVHGTEFVVAYDRVAEMTEAVGITGTVTVHSQLDRVGRGVLVNAQELTRVARGQFPTRPQRLDDPIFRQYIEGLEFVGTGRPESMAVGLPLLTTSGVAPQTTSGALLGPLQAPPFPGAGKPDEDYMRGQRVGGVGALLGNNPPAVLSKDVELGIRF
jgi:hypothetical protein